MFCSGTGLRLDGRLKSGYCTGPGCLKESLVLTQAKDQGKDARTPMDFGREDLGDYMPGDSASGPDEEKDHE